SGVLALDPDAAGRGDGHSGPRDARLQGDRLGDADEDGITQPDVPDVPALPRATVHDIEDDPEHREHDRDQPWLAQLLVDEVLAGRARDGAGDRPDDQPPCQTLVRGADGAARDRDGPRLK